MWVATSAVALSNLPALFQSNATRVGCNVFAVAVDDEYIRDFNLTQPVWVATDDEYILPLTPEISI